MTPLNERFILHVDMDAFFAAVEQLDRPGLRGKPVLVGGDPEGRGVVSTASYEARPFGCHSAMPMARAVRLCPEAIVVRPRMQRYAEVSQCVLDILDQFSPLVEPLSIDEAFLDLTGSTRLLGEPGQIARKLKQRIHDETGLSASVGVAPSKFLSKLASDIDKPDGLVMVEPSGVQEFLDPLPISRLWGVGKATQSKLEALGVHTFSDLRRFTQATLRQRFGRSGEHFYRLVRGIDDRSVVPDRKAKSISHEVTFSVDIEDYGHLRDVLLGQTDQVARRLRRHGRSAKTATMKVRTGGFKTRTRSVTLKTPTDATETIWRAVSALFEDWRRQGSQPVRLIGVGVSQLSAAGGEQFELFGPNVGAASPRLDRAVDEIRDRFGDDAIRRGPNVALSEPERLNSESKRAPSEGSRDT